MSVAEILDNLRQFADIPHDSPDMPGRARAVSRLVRVSAHEDEPVKVVPQTLGDLLGYYSFSINEQEVIDRATNNDGKDSDDRDPPTLDELHTALREAIHHEILRQHNIKPSQYTDADISGKGDKGFLRVKDSVPFDLGDQQWRLGDMLRPKVTLLGELTVDFTKLNMVDKESLGDGVVAVLQPSLLGLPADTIDHYQIRIPLRSPHDQRITRVFKGIVMLHPDADNSLAWHDGYGQDIQEGVLQVYALTKGSTFRPRSRATIQGMYYQGIPGWANYLFSQENVTRLTDDESSLLEERLIAADVPVRALGGQGLQILMARVTSLTVYGGRARMGLPAVAFKHIKGLEHIAEIEHERSLFDNNTAFDSVASENHAHLPSFYAPLSLKRYYAANGGINAPWVLNRLPDLPTGQCAIRHRLVGYQPFNAMVVPTWSLLLAGNDFDGDIIKCMPPTERGGLYIAFNDRTRNDQIRRLAGATVNRSLDKSKYVYPDGVWRWAGQLQSATGLGRADLSARRSIDKGDPEFAYKFQPYIQWLVDIQKRPLPCPVVGGLKAMPKIKPDREGMVFATDLLRDVSKGKREDRRKSRTERQWGRFYSKLEALTELDTIYMMLRAGQDPIHVVGGQDTARLMAAWGRMTHERMSLALRQIPRFTPPGSGRSWPLPHVIDFPDRELAEELPEIEINLLGTLRLLERYWDDAYRANGEVRQGLFNLKDALLDVAKGLEIGDQLAEHAQTYRVFRIFANTPQLRAYFQGIAGLRISDLFPLYSPSQVMEVTFEPNDTLISNNKPIYLGLSKIDANDLVLRLHRPTGRYFLRHGPGETELLGLDLDAAMLHARSIFNQAWLKKVLPIEECEVCSPAA